ncbi:MAG: DHH family phosphoesterase [Chloroflexota bacterium]
MGQEQKAEQRNAAVRLLRESQRVAILSHINPDGDTLGSALALSHGLRQLGKRTVIFCPDSLPANLAFLPGYEEIQTDGGLPEDLDLIAFVDASDTGRHGRLSIRNRDVPPHVRLLNIDHHQTNDYFGEVNFVDPDAAATGEQIYDILQALQVAIDLPIATCLLTALVTDTQGFRTANTTSRTLAIAARLREMGAPLSTIVECVYFVCGGWPSPSCNAPAASAGRTSPPKCRNKPGLHPSRATARSN